MPEYTPSSCPYIRRQLTLFAEPADAKAIEAIRGTFNPEQRRLIDCHVTLCREDELSDLEIVIDNLCKLESRPLTIRFGKPVRFGEGKGVLIPGEGPNEEFHRLRKMALKGLTDSPRHHEPHITLIHPRNAACTDAMFETIRSMDWPAQLEFRKIALIEQADGGAWATLREFAIAG